MSERVASMASLSATRLEYVDEVCDRFEQAGKAGNQPRIEDYLTGETEPTRSVLLYELLIAELDWRRRLGESPDRPEYLERFADHASLIDSAFQAAEAGGGRREVALRQGPFEQRGAGSETAPFSPGDRSPGGPIATGQRFRILRPHAQGGLGIISIAYDAELRREVALKEIQPRLASRSESRARFLREAEITGGLEHPGIVPVYSLGRAEDGRPYYAMRLIDGTTLKEAISEFHKGGQGADEQGARTLSLRRLLDRFRTVCEALAYAHSRGVLHRDIKPHNIMVGRFGETLLVDWGLAKALALPDMSWEKTSQPTPSVGADWSDETAAGSALGTPAYMSPEQAEGQSDRLGPASDVYGLGATLYHLLTGRSPFEGSLKEVLEKVRHGDFLKPRAVRPDISRALEAVCLKAMALRPEDRYPSARDLADDVERWLADEPVSAWREPFPLRAKRWAKRHRTVVIAVSSAVLLTALAISGCVLAYCFEHIRMTSMPEMDHHAGSMLPGHRKAPAESVQRPHSHRHSPSH